MPVTIDLTDALIYQALGNFLVGILDPAVEVIQAQENRVPSPIGPNYVVMNSVTRTRLATNVETWDTVNPAPTAQTVLIPTQASVQLDIHGPFGADNATIIDAMFRSGYGCDVFTVSGFAIQPLYADEAKQIPFTNGEQQYEDRWTFDVHMQIDPSITRPQDSANQAHINVINVDATYPPGG